MTVSRRKDRPRLPLMGTLQQPAAGNNSLRQTVIAGQSNQPVTRFALALGENLEYYPFTPCCNSLRSGHNARALLDRTPRSKTATRERTIR
jgi:hypothetical protein